MSDRVVASYFDPPTDPLAALQEMSTEEVLLVIEKARQTVCDKAKTIETEVEDLKVTSKAARENIKVLKEEQAFFLGRLSAAEEGLKRKTV